jgi:hypothetical protein
VRPWRVDSDATFEGALQEALTSSETCLIELAIQG